MTPQDTAPTKVLTVFGTRPEVIKLAPIIEQLEARPTTFRAVNVTSAQHHDLLYPFIRLFGLQVHHDLHVMAPNQTPNQICSRVLASLEPVLAEQKPHLLLVQGDTTTALAATLAGFYRRIPVGHVEAGLRSGNPLSPYPEEMNRRLISRLASYHFAATPRNLATLLSEGVAPESIFITGNPVVDSLHAILGRTPVTPTIDALLAATTGLKRIVLTTHRRESFGEVLAQNLRVLRAFIARHKDVALLFPVHPNPAVVGPATLILSGHPRIHLIRPLRYDEFIHLLTHSWLIVSDSGGVQEEAPTLGKPLLILRENTERPEALDAGVARLVGGSADRLAIMLDEAYQDVSWARHVETRDNPFGRGDSGKRIVDIIATLFPSGLSPVHARCVEREPDRY